MLFNSIEYLLFLPIVFLLYWFVFAKNLKAQNLYVVMVSYLFYGWWDWRFLILIAFTTFCSYLSGLLIEHVEGKPAQQRWICGANIVLNLAILALFKYYNFFVTSFADLFLQGNTDGLLIKVILPVGISFYTFQALSYSIDVYRKKLAATHDVVAFFAFVSFFPQLVAGPIERATNLLPQMLHVRKFDYSQAVDGMRQILWGFFKKVVIADNCAIYVNHVFENYAHENSMTLVTAAVLFSIQIYGDFSGYSDIAIGTGRLFGIHLMQNFNVPYFSRDIAEFWRRWHISLTTWFRDYIYIPLGGSRVSKVKVVRNTLIIFLISGFWHGANWTFIVWGLFHALLFLPLILTNRNRKHVGELIKIKSGGVIFSLSSMLFTFGLATLGWIVFRAQSISEAWDYLRKICTFSTGWPSGDKLSLGLCLLFVGAFISMEWLTRNRRHGLDVASYPAIVRYGLYIAVACSILYYRAESSSFIYFQF